MSMLWGKIADIFPRLYHYLLGNPYSLGHIISHLMPQASEFVALHEVLIFVYFRIRKLFQGGRCGDHECRHHLNEKAVCNAQCPNNGFPSVTPGVCNCPAEYTGACCDSGQLILENGKSISEDIDVI